MGTTRFYEFLAVEHPDLNVFIVQPGVIRTALYEKGELQMDDLIDSSKYYLMREDYQATEGPLMAKANVVSIPVQLPAHFTVWLTSSEAKPLSGRILFANWDVEQLKSIVVPRLQNDPVYLTTTFGGFPFAG